MIQWWEILVGVIFILSGIACFFFTKRSKESVDYYKKLQLEEYKKQNPRFRGDYESAKLILPWSQRMKLVMWPVIGLSLIIVGFCLSTGLVFSFFIR